MTHTDDTIEKLNTLWRQADEAAKSKKFSEKVGSCTIKAALVEFTVIQAYRALEQVVAKSLIQQGKSSEVPKLDDFFYDEKISSRLILKKLKELNDVILENEDSLVIKQAVKKFMIAGHKFLNQRNQLVHHMANPAITLSQIETTIDQCHEVFLLLHEEHTSMMESAQPFTLTQEQKAEFYN